MIIVGVFFLKARSVIWIFMFDTLSLDKGNIQALFQAQNYSTKLEVKRITERKNTWKGLHQQQAEQTVTQSPYHKVRSQRCGQF